MSPRRLTAAPQPSTHLCQAEVLCPLQLIHLYTDVRGGDGDMPRTSAFSVGCCRPRRGEGARPSGCHVLITLSLLQGTDS